MTLPEWLKPGIYGALIGAVALSIVGFSWGGWVTRGEADKMATTLSDDNVIAALVPVCLDISRTDPDRVRQLELITAAVYYKQRDAVMDAGWATVPGAEEPNRELATACLAALDIQDS